MLRKPARDTVWGDGFADDDWTSLAAVDRWSAIAPDEYVRFFPRLAQSAGDVAAPVIDRLSEAVAVRAWRLQRAGGGRPLHSGVDPASGGRLEPAWFAAPSRWSALTRLLWPKGHDREGAATRDAAALLALDPLLASLKAGQSRPFAETDALAVAFYGGLHPAYVWAAAATLHEVFAVAGWLGLLARGRSAFMPGAIADSLDAVVDSRTGRLRDSRFHLCHFTPRQWAAIAVAAGRRRAGLRVPVRLVSGHGGLWQGALGAVMPLRGRRLHRPVHPLVDRVGLPSAE